MILLQDTIRTCILYTSDTNLSSNQVLIGKNDLGVGTESKLTKINILDYYTSHRILALRIKLDISLLFVGYGNNIIYQNILKMKKELFVFVL